MMTQKQRDAILMAKTKKEADKIKEKIREHGDDYDPENDWWPNKYPDM